jgi:hypothetical protein
MKKLIAAAALLITSVAATAQPFGLQMGMTLADLKRLGIKLEKIQKTENSYSAKSIPNGHSRLAAYSFVVTPKAGLCRVVALTPTISTNVYGTELRAEFDKLKDALDARYPGSEIIDKIMPGSIWNEPRDFMMGLLKKERALISYWLEAEHLPDSLSGVSLEATAFSDSKGAVVLQYEYQNINECMDEIKASSSSKL